MKTTFNLTMNPSFGILSSNDQFVYVEQRIGKINDYLINVVVKHIEYFEKFTKENKLKGNLQIRRLFFNDKSGDFHCVLDYLTDKLYEPKPVISFSDEIWIIEGQPSYIDIEIIECGFDADHFDKNHRDYYKTSRVIPWIDEINNYLFKRNSEGLV